MNRRAFLKIIGVASIAPSVLAVAPKPVSLLTIEDIIKAKRYLESEPPCFIGHYIRARGAEAISKGQVVAYKYGLDEQHGIPWVKPIPYKDFYIMPKNGVK